MGYMSSNTGSGPTYRHEHSKSFKEGGVKFTVKEELKYGELGLSFRFLQKAGDDNSKFYMISVKEGPKGKYAMTEKKGEKQTESEIDEKALMKIIKDNKALAFVAAFLADPKKDKYKGKYGKKSSKKASKKSKKASKKASKKSKKASKKAVGGKKKASKKSKKASKKSKKVSKKSKKASKKSK